MNEINWLYIGFTVVVLWPVFFWVLYSVIRAAVVKAIRQATAPETPRVSLSVIEPDDLSQSSRRGPTQ